MSLSSLVHLHEAYRAVTKAISNVGLPCTNGTREQPTGVGPDYSQACVT